MTKAEAARIVAGLMAAFPQSKTSEQTAIVYEAGILDLDYQVARRAADRLLKSSQWLPTIATIREECQMVTCGPKRSGEEAWAIVQLAIRRVGRWSPEPRWKDPAIARAVKLWPSWQDLCDSPENDPGGRARFVELYDSVASRDRREAAIGALPAGDLLKSLGAEALGKKTSQAT